MADLLDEAGETAASRVAGNVRNLGGDLLDEAGIQGRDTSMLSPSLAQQRVTEERRKTLRTLNDELSTFEKLRVAVGRGATNIARGVGLAEPEHPAVTGAVEDLRESSKVDVSIPFKDEPITVSPVGIGEVFGEVLPFLPAGVGIGGIRALGWRVLASIGLGAAEGAAIVRGRGGDAGETTLAGGVGGVAAGTVEAFLPTFLRLGSRVFRSLGRKPKGPLITSEGKPTPEFQAALDEVGASFDDLAEEAFTSVNTPGVDPVQAARSARFTSEGIPATKGDITQDFAQQAREARLESMAAAEAGEPLRQFRLQQSQAFEGRVNELVEGLGVPPRAGESIKEALTGRKTLLRNEKNRLYKEAAEASPEVANLPLFTDSLIEALPDPRKARRLGRLAGNQMEALNDLLVEFGIDTSEEALQRFDGEIVPLTLGNFEEFRAALNQIGRADTTGAANVAIQPLKEALDREAMLIDDQVKASGLADEGVLATLKEARSRVRQLHTEFSPESITGRMVNVRRDGVTPVLEASKISDKLLRPTTPIEHLERTLTSLRAAGAPGRKGIGDLQASVVLNALEAGLRAPTRKTSGTQTVSGTQFAKVLDKFGPDRLDMLFKGSPDALKTLRNLAQIGLDMTPTNAAVPKGSAPVILDAIKRIGRVPGLEDVLALGRIVIRAGGDSRAVRRALQAKPDIQATATLLTREFPTLASALGVVALVDEEPQQ